MSKKKLIQGVLWAAVIAWTMLALFLTFQNGADTAQTSGKIAKEIYRILGRCGIVVEYAKLHQTLRIIAHFVLFCIFGMLLEAAIIVSSCHPSMLKSCFPALLICTVISIIPEVVKLWIPGRHLQWDEVLLNIIGAYGGVFMIALGMKKRKRNDDTSLK